MPCLWPLHFCNCSLEPRPSTQFFFTAVEKIALIFSTAAKENFVECLGSRLLKCLIGADMLYYY